MAWWKVKGNNERLCLMVNTEYLWRYLRKWAPHLSTKSCFPPLCTPAPLHPLTRRHHSNSGSPRNRCPLPASGHKVSGVCRVLGRQVSRVTSQNVDDASCLRWRRCQLQDDGAAVLIPPPPRTHSPGCGCHRLPQPQCAAHSPADLRWAQARQGRSTAASPPAWLP